MRDVVPVECGVDDVEPFCVGTVIEREPDRGHRVLGERPVDPPLAVAWPGDRKVDGEKDGPISELDGLGDQLVGDPVIAEDVDLEEPERVGCGRGDVGRCHGSRTSRGTRHRPGSRRLAPFPASASGWANAW